MSHYETLGVDPKASASEVKRAYRKKAAKAHPDRGGDGEAMAEVNKAYEVLIDPRRRQTYDASGEDGGRPIAEQAQESLAAAFAAALNGDVPNIVVAVRKMLEMERAELAGTISVARRQRSKFLGKRDKVRSKTKVNLVHVLIDQAVVALDAKIANAEEALQVNAAVGKMLDNYDSDEPVEIVMPTRASTFWTRY